MNVHHRSLVELERGLADVAAAPTDDGTIVLIVRRPAMDERESVREALVDVRVGVVGDNWLVRGSKSSEDGRAKPKAQLTLMSARAAGLIAGDASRWPLAGDQFYVEFDLSVRNVPAGTQLVLGSAVIEVTDLPHTGCDKFAERFGLDALRLVSSESGRALNLRGVNARVVTPGRVAVGDTVRKSWS